MKKNFRRFAPVALVLIGLATLSFMAKGGITLRLKPQQGKTYTLSTKSNTMMMMDVQGQTMNQSQSMEFRQTFTPKNVTDKESLIETQVEAMKMTMSVMGQKLEYDSDHPEKTSPMLAGQTHPDAIVLAGETWHQGVVGIVASRLAEDYGCPVFLICLSGETGKASSRSYGGFPLFSTLEQLSDLLENFGGHELAAGFTIRRENIDRFREEVSRLSRIYRQSHPEGKVLEADCAIPPELLTLPNVAALDQLEPYGAEFPLPLFYMDDLKIRELQEVGGGKHLKLQLTRDRHTLPCIFFSTTACQAAVAMEDTVEIAYTPQVNEFRGERSVQLKLTDVRPDLHCRQAIDRQREVYGRFLEGRLTAPESIALIPPREEFAAVWRYLSARAQNGTVTDEFSVMARKIARSANLPCSFVRTRVCLDVLAERGLIQMEQGFRAISIRLTPGSEKVDLQRSAILVRLRNDKEGE